jgi:lipopolysaccharide export system protein LptC
MTGHDNFHSTAVAWLKVVLPLLALAILSTLFLFSRKIDPSEAIHFAEVDIADRVREPRLTKPTWAGVTDDGTALTIAASEARPKQTQSPQDSVSGASADTLVADLQAPDGSSARLVAAQGVLDTQTNALLVDGGVTITTSTGYTLQTEAMTAALDRTLLVSETTVTGDGPAGTVTAGAMELRQATDGTGAYVLLLKNRVKLLYLPPKQ